MTLPLLALATMVAWTAPAMAAERLACPSGTAAMDVPQPSGSLHQCQRPDGTAHGPSQRLDSAGKILERGFFEDGFEQGSWRYYDGSGRVVRVGQMSSGRPAGAWTHFDPSGEPSATLTHGLADSPDLTVESAEDPRVRWAHQLPSAATQIWPVSDTMAAISVGETALWLVNLIDGGVRGVVPLPAALRPDIVVHSELLLAVTAPGELLVVDLGGDVVSWKRVRTPVGITHAGGILADGTIAVRSGLGRIDGIDPDSGDQLWTSKLYVDEVAPIVAGDVVVAVREAREVRAVTLGTGAFAWQARMSASVVDLLALGSRVHVLTSGGELLALDRGTGAPLWSLSLPTGPAVAATLTLRDDALWVATPHAAWRVERRLGTVLDERHPTPPEGEDAADLVVGTAMACTSGRRGGIRCDPGGWELATAPAVVAPLMAADGVVLLAHADGALTALDDGLGAALEGIEASGAVLLEDGLVAADITLEGITWEVDLPWVVVEQPGAEEECSLVTAAVGLPPPSEVMGWLEPVDAAMGGSMDGASDARPVAPVVTLVDLPLPHQLGDGAFSLPESWDVEEAGAVWRMSWWHRHRPTLTSLVATLGDASDAAKVDALLRCETGPARFRGQVRLDDGYRTMEVTGMLDLVPHPHSLDDERGCLLDLSAGGEDLGSWSSVVLPAWTEVVMEVGWPDELPDLGLDADDIFVPPQVSGAEVVLDLYEPWQLQRTTVVVSGEVDLRVDEGDARGPILRAFSGERLLAEVPVPDLRYGHVGLDEDGAEVPLPDVEDIVHLTRPLPESADTTVWRVAWQRSSCFEEVGAPRVAEDAAQAPAMGDQASPSTDSDAVPQSPPLTTPTPMAPPKSRWRRGRMR